MFIKSLFIFLFILLARFPVFAAEQEATVGKFELVSSAFKNNEEIAAKYTCHGGDVNPPLEFKNIPKKTKAMALTIQDLDAPEGVWVHWVVYNIPPTANQIPPNVTPGYEALNDYGKYAYKGPCPMDEKVHRYIFKAYAVNKIIPIDDGMTIKDVEKEISRHTIAKSELIGTYRKPIW